LTVYTNQPGILFNPGRQLNAIQTGPNGQSFPQFSGFTARTQNYPDSVNHVNFPDSVLREGSTYIHNVRFLFSVSDM
jgi:aldose 1-epimerase